MGSIHPKQYIVQWHFVRFCGAAFGEFVESLREDEIRIKAQPVC